MMMINLNKKPNSLPSNRGIWIRRVIVILVILAILIGIPTGLAYVAIKDAASHGKALGSAYQNQNFGLILKEISQTKQSLGNANLALSLMFWLKAIPIFGGYYGDAKSFTSAGLEELTALEKLFTILKENEEELGFKGQAIAGQDRISQGIKVLEKAIPHLDKIQDNFKKAADEVRNVDVDKYPESIGGTKVRENLRSARDFMVGADVAISEARPAIEKLPNALGDPNAKNYLLLFQNDKEIRATGGFLTASAFLKLDKGQISTSTSDDIYRLDERLLKICESKVCPLRPPAPIVKYLPEENGKPRTAWSMRDSNISPDVPTAAKEFERMYEMLGEGLNFDGLIYIDTQVVEELIGVTGPIEVLGTTYSSEIDDRCNCPNVIYELESYAEIAQKGEQDRKAILGVLMQQLLARSIGADLDKIPQLIQTIVRLANHKHIMFYMHDSQLQDSLVRLDWVGAIKSYDGDYLHINDSNFAGGKSNLYVEQTVTQEIRREDGKMKKKITIEYKNPQKFNTWLNGINRDYVRLYVPKGSKLISNKGSDDPVNTFEELDKTVFEAFVTVRPENSRILSFEYEIPYNPEDEYKLLIQKQPGAKDFKYVIKFHGSEKENFLLEADQEIQFDI